VADRGFADHKLYRVLTEKLKEAWRLAAGSAEEPARALVNLYAKRWGIKGAFRDTQDLGFGRGGTGEGSARVSRARHHRRSARR